MLNKQDLEDKKLLKLERRYNELRKLIEDTAEYIPLEKPIRNGYYYYLTLVNAEHHKDNEILQELVKCATDRFWVERKNNFDYNFMCLRGPKEFRDWYYKENKFTPSLKAYTLKLNALVDAEVENLSKKFQGIEKYLGPGMPYRYTYNGKIHYNYSVEIPKALLKPHLEKSFINGYYIYDTELISERDKLTDYLYNNAKHRGRLSKIQGWPAGWNWDDRKNERIKNKELIRKAAEEYFNEKYENDAQEKVFC